MNKICAFFGHRTMNEDISAKLHEAIRTAIEEYGVRTFWCGGYGQFDAMAATVAYEMKSEYPDIEVVLVRAYMPKQREVLSDLYDSSIYPGGLETVPYRFAISHRNKWMAKNCDFAITYSDHTYGGAYKAYRAIEKRKTVFHIGKEIGDM